MKVTSVWLLMKKQTQLLRCRGVEWYVVGIPAYTDAKSAREAAQRFEANSSGWSFKAVQFTRRSK